MPDNLIRKLAATVDRRQKLMVRLDCFQSGRAEPSHVAPAVQPSIRLEERSLAQLSSSTLGMAQSGASIAFGDSNRGFQAGIINGDVHHLVPPGKLDNGPRSAALS